MSSLIVISCGPSSEKDPTYTNVWNEVLSDQAQNCGRCHGPGSTFSETLNGPDLSNKSSAYKDLYDKSRSSDFPGWGPASNCDTIKLIAPENASSSLVVASLDEKINETITTCTSSFDIHKHNNVTLSSSELKLLKDWINKGAEDN